MPVAGSFLSTVVTRSSPFVGAVRQRHLPGVQRIADADAAAVVERRPARPDATFTMRFRSGQSATASEPSRIASVSRLGDATDPASRWSLPMTMGALTRARSAPGR